MKIIDNFLEEEYFNTLAGLICNTDFQFTWFYGRYLREVSLFHANRKLFPSQYEEFVQRTSRHSDLLQYFFTHLFYEKNIPQSPHYNQHEINVQGLCGEIDARGEGIKSLLRIRANYFQNTSTLHEYDMHIDYKFHHTAAILSLNTCDGYTKLKDGTKIDSVANRMLFFDAGSPHCSTTTTNKNARFNLIVNYL